LAPFEQTESLYRRYGTEFSKGDRRSIQEFFFLCECEAYLMRELKSEVNHFRFTPTGSFFKGQGEQTSAALRKHFGYKPNEVPSDVYNDFRTLGFHVFRRRLENSNISGLTIQHPSVGTCILVNYSEDIYRQRFTAAHEGAHGILDRNDDVIVSFADKQSSLIETRANTFASRYLLPLAITRNLPVRQWNHAEIVKWASHFKVSTYALAIALKEAKVIDDKAVKELRRARVPAQQKVDPELATLDGEPAARKEELLSRGLSSFYVSLCLAAWNTGIVTRGRVAEMLLVNDFDLWDVTALFGMRPAAQ
jgi:Zn-dependent peptidase ImmA (M78 family)